MKKRLNFVYLMMGGALLATAWISAHADAIVAESDLRSTPFANATYGPGVVQGRAHLVTDAKSGTTKVVAHLEGLTPGTGHIGHIHNGDCERLFPGVILHDLEPIVINAAGVGASKTVIPEGMGAIQDCEWWVAFHEGPANADPQTPAIAVGPVLIRDKRQGR